ncbi:Ig-like domain-containing protein [Paenibacillus agri]|uniref:Tandem-95 repeat protein n=1 Tax=Paenibacillus agri TaxID=2744309 RepID=A0A850EW55_9BACL|nr:Ig-like domain-containing protein [Paenibacillus agri]NUU64160.1 tandem-95 repeat protein [Paenibacillus agri]
MMSLLKKASMVLCSLAILLPITLSPLAGSTVQKAQAATERTFKIAVLPDTQMYSRYKPEIFDAQTDWIKKFQYSENIVFTTHLGDIVDRSTQEYEWKNADKSMKTLDDAKIPYGYTTGNHDIADWLDDDSRDDNDRYNQFFNQYFKPASRMGSNPGFGATSPKGYSSYYTFQGAGKTFLVLFIDWRAGSDTLKWANQVLHDHPNYPTILVTHQLLNIDSDGKTAVMTDNGQFLWDQLIKGNDQIFLTLNGHHHGSAQMIKKNDSGHDVLMSVIDYQGYYMGGNGIMRTLEFNLDAGTISAKTFSPWVMNLPADQRDATYDIEELTDPNNKFTVNMDFKDRFKGIWDEQNNAPQATDVFYNTADGKTLSAKLKATDKDADALTYSIVSPPTKGTVKLTDAATGSFLYTPAAGMTGTDTFTFKVNDGFVDSNVGTATINIRDASAGNGEVAHWRFEKPADGSFNVKDISGNGNDLYRVDLMTRDVPDIDMKWSDDKSPFSKSNGSLEISSYGKKPEELSYLRTSDDAMLNKMTFQNGYTIEAYFRIAKNFDASKNGWMGILGRGGTGAEAGKTDGDKEEPIATLSISTLKEVQWAAYPTNLNGLKTNWSGETFFDWVHVAIVNDTHSTKMYINGSPVLRNDEGESGEPLGLATAMRNGKYVPWIVGAYAYDNVFEKGFNGGINEIRITDHALDHSEFLMNENEIPVSNDMTVETNQNKEYNGILSATDTDMNPLSYEIMDKPANGLVTVDKQTGKFVYIPNRDYNGSDQFTYRAYDGKAYSNIARVSITVIKNNPPVVHDISLATAPGKPLNGMLKADDADGDMLTFKLLKQPSKGTIQFIDPSTGAFQYIPDNGQTGPDYFIYNATDGKNESAEAAVIVQIGDSAVGSGDWKASNLEYSVRQGQTLTATVSDAVYKEDHDKIKHVKLLKLPEKGHVTVTEGSNGAFEYKPDAGKSGIDVFTFQISDETRTTNEAYVFVHIEPNSAPVASNVQLQTTVNNAVDGHMNARDMESDALVYRIIDQPKYGLLTVTDATYGAFKYVPNSGFTGTDTFTYQANDGVSDSNIAVVSIDVSAPPSNNGNNSGGGISPAPTPTPAATPQPTATPTPSVEQLKPTPSPQKPAEGNVPTTGSVTFNDLSKHWAKEAVDKLSKLNIVSGYPDGSFKPEREMTRAEFAALIVKALKLKEDNGPSFQDMNGHWADAMVRTAAKAGIIEGVSASSFAPELKITREQMAVIIARALNMTTGNEGTLNFTDKANISPWAVVSLKALASRGIIQGYADGSFRPDKPVSRAEAATVIVKMLDMQD